MGDKVSTFWFVEEPGHIDTLAESCLMGNADSDDIDRIYWLGRRLKEKLIEVELLRAELAKEKEFNIDLKRIAHEIYDSANCDSCSNEGMTPVCTSMMMLRQYATRLRDELDRHTNPVEVKESGLFASIMRFIKRK